MYHERIKFITWFQLLSRITQLLLDACHLCYVKVSFLSYVLHLLQELDQNGMH